jgi:hypothetical protein
MDDKTFIQSLEELNQHALKDIIDEALHCWTTVQRGSTVESATAHIENKHMKEAVTHLLFYMLLQLLLFDAKQRQLIPSKRYEELKRYVDILTDQMKPQPFMVLPFYQ